MPKIFNNENFSSCGTYFLYDGVLENVQRLQETGVTTKFCFGEPNESLIWGRSMLDLIRVWWWEYRSYHLKLTVALRGCLGVPVIIDWCDCSLPVCLFCVLFQERIARSHGSQCGFCTPGIVMSMYTLLRNDGQPSQETMEQAFQGSNEMAATRLSLFVAVQTKDLWASWHAMFVERVNG